MKICGAQTKPVTGNIEANIEMHLLFIDSAISSGADLIIFSELSLTGYEPTLARKLATRTDDERFDVFQKISNERMVSIGVGVPTISGDRVFISMVLFQPNKPPLVYSKKYIHPDEEPFFVSGVNFPSLIVNDTSIGLAICYELSIPEHISSAHKSGAQVYVASVAKFAKGVESAVKTLSDISIRYSIPTLMVNAVGPADNGMCTGNSSVWNSKGQLAGQLGSSTEGIIVYNTVSGEIVEKTI
ncbi:MAG TPA: carbon-nitrogen hydrolase family protein [Chryseolinea sp.]|nr:carbon-nitrogen hydrolase family protein [Chryseolinea sp.]